MIRKQRRSKTVSFRIDAELEGALRDQASQKGLSLNSYVNSLFRKCVELTPILEQLTFIFVPKQLLVEILRHIDEKTLTSLASDIVAPSLKEIAYSLRGKADLEALRTIIEAFTKHGQTHAIPSQWKNGEEVILIIQHEISRQLSILVGETIKTYVKDLGMHAEYEVTRNATILTIRTKNKGTP